MSMSERVLLLNASYEPICVLSVNRAVILVLEEKAEVVAEGKTLMRSPSVTIVAPSVIRLVRYVNIPRFRKAYLGRKAILQRDNHECCYCGGVATTMDHIIPRSRQGAHSWTNIVACCYDCNQTKDDRTFEEMRDKFGWKMRYQPYEPEGNRRLVLIVGSVDPAWEEWMAVA